MYVYTSKMKLCCICVSVSHNSKAATYNDSPFLQMCSSFPVQVSRIKGPGAHCTFKANQNKHIL